MTNTRMQVLLGLYMHAFLSRREAMSVFQHMWKALQRWGVRSQELPRACKAELAIAVCHLPV
eukprot:621711-Amphidinium_carterae.1